jgi:hypothetical protein
MEVIRRYAPKNCSTALEEGIQVIDNFLDNAKTKPIIKGLFNLTGITHDDDFASTIEVSSLSSNPTYLLMNCCMQTPLEYWQSKVWGKFNSPTFDNFCAQVVKPTNLSSSVATLPYGDAKRLVKIADGVSVDYTLVNYATWIKTVGSF